MDCDHLYSIWFDTAQTLPGVAMAPPPAPQDAMPDRQARMRQAIAALMQDRAFATAVARGMEARARTRARAEGPRWTRPWLAADAVERRTG